MHGGCGFCRLRALLTPCRRMSRRLPGPSRGGQLNRDSGSKAGQGWHRFAGWWTGLLESSLGPSQYRAAGGRWACRGCRLSWQRQCGFGEGGNRLRSGFFFAEVFQTRAQRSQHRLPTGAEAFRRWCGRQRRSHGWRANPSRALGLVCNRCRNPALARLRMSAPDDLDSCANPHGQGWSRCRAKGGGHGLKHCHERDRRSRFGKCAALSVEFRSSFL
jgi:hypothetical protein